MSRLVDKKKFEMSKLVIEKNGENAEDIHFKNVKLGQLEDIEEELGIDLCHIMEAMLNGYYWRSIDGNIYNMPKLDFIRKDTCDESPCRPNHYYWNHTGKYLEDYGKTWALTKEELE